MNNKNELLKQSLDAIEMVFRFNLFGNKHSFENEYQLEILKKLKYSIKEELSPTKQEIKLGDFITVDKWLSHTYYSYCGDVLEVMLIDYPLIRVYRHSKYSSGDNITLDLRKVAVRKLSKYFVDDVVNNK